MSYIAGNTLFTIEGLKEKSHNTHRYLITKVTEAMERVELCENCYPKLGEEMTLFFEDTTIKINFKQKNILIDENAHQSEPV